jgi:formamidopyrimidine-DNA glycosylase
MPELPEIVCRAREMAEALPGRTITGIEVLQPKCLNVTPAAFTKALCGGTIQAVSHRGKWIVTETTGGVLLINLGMGGELLLVSSRNLPAKWRVRFALDQRKHLVVNFWWFGYVHYVTSGAIEDHPMIAALGPDALDVTLPQFRGLLRSRRGAVKAFLLDQSKLAGIGNAYIHDILFRARLHPLRMIPSLSSVEVHGLHRAIHTELRRSIEKGGAFYEVGLDGKPGGFTAEDLLVGYREGKACPTCGAPVTKIKTGSTSSFVCLHCQPLL